jgi:hypothetical protein
MWGTDQRVRENTSEWRRVLFPLHGPLPANGSGPYCSQRFRFPPATLRSSPVRAFPTINYNINENQPIFVKSDKNWSGSVYSVHQKSIGYHSKKSDFGKFWKNENQKNRVINQKIEQ